MIRKGVGFLLLALRTVVMKYFSSFLASLSIRWIQRQDQLSISLTDRETSYQFRQILSVLMNCPNEKNKFSLITKIC